jgi:prophage tail gpP-like protein
MASRPGEAPEEAVIALEIRELGLRIDTWKSYRYNSHFLTPTDGWSFTLGDESLKDSITEKIAVGQRVTLSINGHVQGDGYIDALEVSSSRNRGTDITVHGRDRLAPVVDSCIDPATRFTAGMTLFDVVQKVFSPFGWLTDADFLVSNETNRNVITGQSRGTPTSKKGKPLKSFTLHQLKPYPHEGAFQFAARIAQRFGLWIWLSAEGNVVILAKPSFEQEARYTIRHKRGTTGPALRNNVLSGQVRKDGTEQPSVIIATGHGGGGEHPRAHMKVAMINELVGLDDGGSPTAEVAAVLAKHPDAKVVEQRSVFGKAARYSTKARPLFLHDDESKTLEQLEGFVKREMALKQRNSMVATYTVEGHTQNDIPWCVDTMVDVDDDVSNVHESLWLLSRTFEKGRNSGTTTTIELIRPYTLDF